VLLDLIRNDDPLGVLSIYVDGDPPSPVAARQSTSRTGLSNWSAT
jgi:hypothetical protein